MKRSFNELPLYRNPSSGHWETEDGSFSIARDPAMEQMRRTRGEQGRCYAIYQDGEFIESYPRIAAAVADLPNVMANLIANGSAKW